MNVQRPTLNTQRSMNSVGTRYDSPKYDLEERLLDYASRIIRLVERLPNTRSGNHVAGQLLRCGTSPLPNHGEAQAAESAADFIHKLSICLKELRESRRWLRLSNKIPFAGVSVEVDSLIGETEELIKIFAASIRTAKENKSSRKTAGVLPLKVGR